MFGGSLLPCGIAIKSPRVDLRAADVARTDNETG